MTDTNNDVDSGRSRNQVRRTVQVMEAFSRQPRWGVRELASSLGVPKSGLHRILQEMATERLLVTQEDGSYEVGGDLLRLAAALLQSSDLTRVAREHIRRARDITDESVILVTYDEGRQQIVAVDTARSSHPIQFVWTALREWTDLHLSASGLGVLAALPERELERYFATPRLSTTGKPVTRETIEPVLEATRQRGWALSRAERIPGAMGVCAAIRDADGDVKGGVVIAWPNREEQDVDADAIGAACREAADATSAELGWTG